jgi:chorismate synthase
MASGQEIILRVGVKPIPSISRVQQTVNSKGEAASITIAGRHDICAIPRIVPVLKAMTLLTLADFVLLQRRVGR